MLTFRRFNVLNFYQMIFEKLRNHSDRYFVLCLVLIAMIAVASVLMNISGSLTVDEPFSANLVNLPWTEMSKVFLHDPSAPLYYFLLKPWVHIFGDSEQAIRSFSVICFALMIIVVGITAQRIEGRFAGLAAALLASISSIGGDFAGTARPYAFLSLLVSINTLIFFHTVDLIKTNPIPTGKKLLWFTGFTIINVIGLLTHPIFIFFMIGCNFAASIKNQQSFWILSLCNLLAIGFYLAVWGSFLIRTISLPGIDWMKVPTANNLIHGYLNLWGIKESIMLILYIFLVSIWNFQSTRDFVMSQKGLIGLVLLMTTSLLPFLVSQYKPVFAHTRTPMLFLPLACVFVGLLITRSKNLKLTFSLLVLLFGSKFVVPVFASGVQGIEDSPRSSINYVVENAKCGDILIAGGLSINETTYYTHRFNAPACLELRVFPQSMNDHPGWMDPLGLLQHSDELAKDADRLVSDINQSLGAHNNVWFFYENHTPRQKVLDILRTQLDQRMILMRSMQGYGTYFESISIYAPKKQVSYP